MFVVITVTPVSVFLPDVDIAFASLIGHRSILTHSAIVPLCVLYLGHPVLAAAMATGFAIHLNADLFPAAWIGFATVKIPLIGDLGAFSFVWLLMNAYILLLLAHWIFYKYSERRMLVIYYTCVFLIGIGYPLVVQMSWGLAFVFFLTWMLAIVTWKKNTGRNLWPARRAISTVRSV